MSPDLRQEQIDHQKSQDANKLDLRNEIQENYGTRAAPWFPWVFEHLTLPEQADIFEAGSGTGMFWEENKARIPIGWNIFLSDMDYALIDRARARMAKPLPHVRCLVLDGQALPFPDERFDAVLAVGLLDLVPDLEQALRELRRILKPGGQFLVTAGGKGHLKEMEALVRPYIPEKQARKLGGDEKRFGLENGKQHLEKYFQEVSMSEYRDTLVFSELQPLLNYILSEQTVLGSLQMEQLGRFVHRIKRRLDKHQSIDVRVRKGVFVARK